MLKLRLLIFCPSVGSPNGNASGQRTLEFARSLSRNNVAVWITSPYLKRQYTANKNLCDKTLQSAKTEKSFRQTHF